jgi:signal transduction histidine kinase
MERGWAWLVDAAVVVVCLVVDVSVTLGLLGDADRATWQEALALAAAVAGPAALWWRRRRPLRVAAVAVATGAMLWVAGVAPVGHGPTVVVVVYTLGATLPRRTALPAVGAVMAAVATHQAATWWVDGFSFAGNLVVLAGAWGLGDAARRRHAETVAHARRAEELAAARDELAQRAVAEERLRIARELHDVVAHAMSAVAVQAGTGRLAFEREPEVARTALANIETMSREALTEMRRLLAVLRPDQEAPARAPMVSLEQVDRLVASSRAAGVAVEVQVTGEPRRLPPGVDVAAFRIVQESLTNVARHAVARRADVRICYGDEAVLIEVDDDGPARSPRDERPGVGIVGMRERAAACGGTLAAAPRPEGGFRVLARLPISGLAVQ